MSTKQSNQNGSKKTIEQAILDGIENFNREQEKMKRATLKKVKSEGTPIRRESKPQRKKTTPSAPQENNPQRKRTEQDHSPRSQEGKQQRKRSGKEISAPPAVQEIRPRKRKKTPVKILFFGGVGEIGKNMTAIEYGGHIIIIDAGIIFPTEDMPGIDLVFPDISYLVQNREKVRALFLTHGHEDHIGGVPYLIKELGNIPIYGTKLTLALTENKLREHKLTGVDLITVSPGDHVKAGIFNVGFVNVNHSIAGALAVTVETPYGIIFHSGDFKIDLTPISGAPIDLEEIASLGKRGVLLYLGESTNIERPGYTMSETVVGTTLEHLFAANTQKRIIIATFASNVHRLQQIIDIAVKFHRRVVLSGRSMMNVVDAAVKIGELTIPEGVLIDVDKIKNYPDRELVIVSTGSQGEPMSALYRMAVGEYNKVTVGANDTIIISASPIPGNEQMIYRVINNLFKLGADVIYESLEKIHVSGHACQEEHKLMHMLLKPKFFIPIHGEYRHLKRHALLAEELGMPAERILIPDIGTTAEVTDETLVRGESFPAGAKLIDGEGFEDLRSSEVLKDRLQMSNDGLLVLALAAFNGVIVSAHIETRGIVFNDEKEDIREIKDLIERVVGNGKVANPAEFTAQLKRLLRNYFLKNTKQSPMILLFIQDT